MSTAASVTSTPAMAMIQGRSLKKVPPSDPRGATTTVNAPAPNGTTLVACRPVSGNRFSLVTRTSLVRRECPR